MALPGEDSCREVASCGDGPWGDMVVDAATEFVDAAYAGGDSDGSEARPWTSIQAGVDAAVAGGVVAVAAGSYVEDVLVRFKPVRLWARCPALVEVVGTGGLFAALVVGEEASGTEIVGLAVRGPGLGLAVSGSEVLVDRIWVHDVGDIALDVENAMGPAALQVHNSLVESAVRYGLFAFGAQARIDATVIRDIRPPGDTEHSGRGIGLEDDPQAGQRSSVATHRVLIERTHDAGASVVGSDGVFEATVVRDVFPLIADQRFGYGVGGQASPLTGARASVVVSTSWIERVHEFGIYLSGSDGAVIGSTVRDILPRATGQFGDGVLVINHGVPAAVEVSRSVVRACERAGMAAFGAAAGVGHSVLDCNAIDLDAELGAGVSATFADRGANVCGCGDLQGDCQVVSTSLEPPEPLR